MPANGQLIWRHQGYLSVDNKGDLMLQWWWGWTGKSKYGSKSFIPAGIIFEDFKIRQNAVFILQGHEHTSNYIWQINCFLMFSHGGHEVISKVREISYFCSMLPSAFPSISGESLPRYVVNTVFMLWNKFHWPGRGSAKRAQHWCNLEGEVALVLPCKISL